MTPHLSLRLTRSALFFGALIGLASSGCGKGSPYLTATGTVKFVDGTVPQGKIASITFQPKLSGPGSKGAQGAIEADGSFQLHSERPGDGARPGDYTVIVHVMDRYPDGKSVVPQKYTNPRTTPLSAEIKASSENHFEFTIEKP